MNQSLNQNALNSLTEQEKSDILFLREEEKLARDTYIYAYEKYGLPIFNHISQSENRHMNRVGVLIEQFGLEEPIKSDTGSFKNVDLQAHYHTFINRIDLSLTDALLVGATIEDLDIYDIEKDELHTQNETIKSVYQLLKCGSRNHMRAFSFHLSQQGVTYEPQFISNSQYKEILQSDKERCGMIYGGGCAH